jgi:hypothetical protein
MKIYLSWTDFKTNVINKSAVRFVDRDLFYLISYNEFESSIPKTDPAGTDQTDFETNYKTLANKTITDEMSPFASKKLGVKSLFNRTHGQTFSLASGSNTLNYTIPYAVCKMNGLEVINAELGDYADFLIVHPTYGTLGQFAFSNYLAPGFYSRISNYDSELVQNLIVRMIYNSISAKTLYVNYLLHEVI